MCLVAGETCRMIGKPLLASFEGPCFTLTLRDVTRLAPLEALAPADDSSRGVPQKDGCKLFCGSAFQRESAVSEF